METLISIIVIIGVAYACFWIIDQAFPAPIQMFAKILVGVVALVVLLKFIGIAF